MTTKQRIAPVVAPKTEASRVQTALEADTAENPRVMVQCAIAPAPAATGSVVSEPVGAANTFRLVLFFLDRLAAILQRLGRTVKR